MNNIATNYLPPSLTENYCDFKYGGTSRVHRTIQCEGNNFLPTIHVKYCIQFDTARGSLRRRIRYLFPRQTRLHPRECWVTIQRVLRDCRRGMINLVQLRVDGTQTIVVGMERKVGAAISKEQHTTSPFDVFIGTLIAR